ncbi:hypothetical protein [Photobacterium atrarenae]|uniref:Lipoprotein n=1 Tax=Photobacterium atrarenae TaxID=865757 RepID=A0ABY5GLZ7_9GAMM|nr:hypothetical protein [Photobacterium atrarenae]UTV29739.1 hypothetical protein NNL38_22275 [Photobacterium atrarenae]
MISKHVPFSRQFVLAAFLSLSGCSSTSLTQTSLPHGVDAHQFRQQYMELYRTQEAMPQPQPILLLKPTPSS